MSTSNVESTLATLGNRWIIRVGKETYEADGKMIELIKQADQAGHRGMIHFRNFSVSIPHIQSMQRLTDPDRKWNEINPQDYSLPELTEEEVATARAKISEIRAKLASK